MKLYVKLTFYVCYSVCMNEGRKMAEGSYWYKHSIHATMVTTIISPWNK